MNTRPNCRLFKAGNFIMRPIEQPLVVEIDAADILESVSVISVVSYGAKLNAPSIGRLSQLFEQIRLGEMLVGRYLFVSWSLNAPVICFLFAQPGAVFAHPIRQA